MVIDREHGTIDSPLHPSQVVLYPWVSQALALLCSRNFRLAIATNQPAAAKGKTTLENLKNVHQRVIDLAEQDGAKILSSHICFHRQEDECACRKPKTGLLEEALLQNTDSDRRTCWMVGDGVQDIQAGQSLSLKTAFIGSKKWDAKRVFENLELRPTVWVENLQEFAELLTSDLPDLNLGA